MTSRGLKGSVRINKISVANECRSKIIVDTHSNVNYIIDSDSMNTIGQFKNELIKDYNIINNEVFGIGSVQQKVDIVDDKLIIIAKNKRVKSLSYLTETDHYVGELANRILIEGFKKELNELLTKKYKFDVSMIFKDYDTKTETSCTLIIMKDDIKRYFKQ